MARKSDPDFRIAGRLKTTQAELAKAHQLLQACELAESALAAEKQARAEAERVSQAAESTLDEIAALCGRHEWEHAALIVHDVAALSQARVAAEARAEAAEREAEESRAELWRVRAERA